VVAAAKAANAYDFCIEFPDGMQTEGATTATERRGGGMLGRRGGGMSL
jgi:ABC-type protease/lipase transport system fused ATPase/permease subunit